MLGLGETKEEVIQTLHDLKNNGVDVVTIGQYLQPTSRHLPVDRWDTATRKPLTTRFVLSDHGNEIVGGLSEAFVLATHARPDKAQAYREPFIKMIDRLLEVGRTPDGVWHHDIDIATGKAIAPRHAHCWGYMFNGVFTAYMVTGEVRFRTAVEQAIASTS